MLRFHVIRDGVVPLWLDLTTFYLIGADNVPIRAEFSYGDGILTCRKRATGPSALALLADIPSFGSVMLETALIPDREEPYVLSLELARGRMMRMIQKREEWGLAELAEASQVNLRMTDAASLLAQALTHQKDPKRSSKIAESCLAILLPLADHTAMTHAELLIARRVSTRSFSRNVFGTQVTLGATDEPYRKLLVNHNDFVQLPIRWRDIEPAPGKIDWRLTDEWVEFLTKSRLPIVGGPLVNLQKSELPEWLEKDKTARTYEGIRDRLYEYIQRVVARYGKQIVLWNVLSGLHLNSEYSLSFDQIMDLTRLAVGLVKKVSPGARTMIELCQPWGEYFANNQRSIPPSLYAEMVVSSGISFDLFGMQVHFGPPTEGGSQRDLFQISVLLDSFASLGKPVILSSMQAPSEVTEGTTHAGRWRKAWSPQLQAQWLETVTNLALSKPFIEAVSWDQILDAPKEVSGVIHFGGLLEADRSPKPAFKTWAAMHRVLVNLRQNPKAPVRPNPPAEISAASE